MSIKEELSRLNLLLTRHVPLRSSRSSDLIVPAQVLVHSSFSQLIFARYFINEFLILRSGDADVNSSFHSKQSPVTVNSGVCGGAGSGSLFPFWATSRRIGGVI